MVSDKDRLYLALKNYGPQTFDGLQMQVGIPGSQLTTLLASEMQKGFIDIKAGKYYIVIMLDSPNQAKIRSFSWEPLMMASMPTKPAWENPRIRDTAHRDQGGRGTCTGQTGGGLMDVNYLELTNDIPSAEDKAKFQRDVVDTPSGVKHDVLYPQSFSAECPYLWGRKEGNVTYPSGGSTQAVMRTLVKRGICFEDEWPTSKDFHHCYLEPLSAEMQAKVDASAPLHKLDGFVSLGNDFDRVCAGIEQYGKVAVSIVCYDNMGDIKGTDGTFPEPKGSESGAHAMLAYGYDENYIKVRHTWGDYCGQYGKFSRNYARRGLMEAFAPIDAQEAARIRENYQKVNITCNITVQVFIDGMYAGEYPKNEISPYLKIGQTYDITVVELAHQGNQKTVEHTVVKGGDTLAIHLDPYVEPEPPKPGIIAIIIKFLKAIFTVRVK